MYLCVSCDQGECEVPAKHGDGEVEVMAFPTHALLTMNTVPSVPNVKWANTEEIR